MRLKKRSISIRLAGPLLAVAVMATFAALTLSAQEPVVGAAPEPAPSASPPSVDSSAMPTDPNAEVAALDAANDEYLDDDVIPMEEKDTGGLETVAGQNLINVTVENETLENVVNMFARISGANIVTTSADLGGTVTVNLRGVEWKPALSSILDVHSLALIEKLPGSGVYTIVPKPAGEDVPLVVETIFLNFTTVAEMGPMARSMLGTSSNSAVTEFASRNAMVVKTTEPNMREIRALVQQMDVPGRQVVVETKFMELADGASKKLGIRWDSLDAYGIRVTPERQYSREVERGSTRSNSKIHTENQSTSENQSSQRSSADDLSEGFTSDGTLVPQTETVVTTHPNDPSLTVTTERDLPSRTVSASSSSDNSSQSSASTSDNILNGVADTFTKSVTDATTALLDFDTFQAVLSALEKTDGVSVISNPKLIVASGSRDAYFTVGEREPIIRTEVTRGTQDSPGDTITAELDTDIQTDYIKQGYLETGIHLQVIPVVKTDDLIEASIEPKLVRRILPDKVVGNNSWPRIAVKEIKTTFTLRSGQTVAIGGLTDSSDDKQVTKVPFLGDIPLIGKYLFTHTSDVKRQVETVIFVTLSLADSQNLYREVGIPEDARLVHRQLIKRGQEREAFEAELEGLRQTVEDEKKAKAEATEPKPKTKGTKRRR